jgi:hypothetical protein
MKPDAYTLIAYKPNNEVCSGGYLKFTYSSEFVKLTTDDKNEIISRLADVLKRNLTLENCEAGFEEIYIYKNGVCLEDRYYPPDDTTDEEDSFNESLVKEYNDIYSAAKIIATEEIKKEKIEAEKLKQLEQERQSAALRERELQLYRELQKKFDGEK